MMKCLLEGKRSILARILTNSSNGKARGKQNREAACGISPTLIYGAGNCTLTVYISSNGGYRAHGRPHPPAYSELQRLRLFCIRFTSDLDELVAFLIELVIHASPTLTDISDKTNE